MGWVCLFVVLQAWWTDCRRLLLLRVYPEFCYQDKHGGRERRRVLATAPRATINKVRASPDGGGALPLLAHTGRTEFLPFTAAGLRKLGAARLLGKQTPLSGGTFSSPLRFGARKDWLRFFRTAV